MNYYVYETTNLINGRKYIGKRKCKCLIEDDSYLGSGTALKEAIKKYGRQNFKKEILAICETEEQAYAMEDFYTLQVNAWENREYYNLKRGGYGNCVLSEETKEKMRRAKVGYVPWNVGKKHSKETIEKLKKAKVGYVPWNVGKKHSKESIEKMRRAKIGKKLSQEHRAKIGLGGRGRKISDEHKEKMRKANLRKYICLNTKEVFEGRDSCARYVNIKSGSAITVACQKGRSAGKINGEPAKWMYYDEYLEMQI